MSALPLPSPGIDLVDTARLAAVIARQGEAFLTRVFTPEEIAYCRSHRDPAPYFAARFAAKEAVAKALRTGIGESAAFVEIEVLRDARGAPSILLHGSAARTAEALGIREIRVSLTHTAGHAAAMVIAV